MNCGTLWHLQVARGGVGQLEAMRDEGRAKTDREAQHANHPDVFEHLPNSEAWPKGRWDAAAGDASLGEGTASAECSPDV